ncbi:hypothetical protein [Poseidonibacter antarcticus]|uniref:hypothetical protein n=1 Tax=Poseidonibacter antarcticus TaxID=2478538 RepID=UPI000EF4EC5E|nr:hypothetical protein [Poseidonibacter antarcticus]
MYFERYLLRTRDNEMEGVFSSDNIDNELYTQKTISNEDLDIYNQAPLEYDLDYASYQYIIATYTKPILIDERENRKLFKFKIIYAKTSDNQAIVNVTNWNELNQLNNEEGPAYTLNVFCVLYDNMIKFGFEYQYHALPNAIIYKLLRNIVQEAFLNIDVLDNVFNSDDFEFGMDFNTTDYEEVFDTSTRSKQIVLYMDSNTEGGEIINSGRTLYSIKIDSAFANVLEFAQNRIRGRGIARYVIKCEDSNGRIATLENNANTNSWEQPARREIEIQSANYVTELFDFLRN